MTASLNISRPREDGRSISQCVDAVSGSLRSERSRTALQYWLSKSDHGRIPHRSTMDPVEMVAFLPSILLIDVIGDHQNYRFRLVGGSIRYHLAHDITGKLLSDTRGLLIGRRLHAALTECTMLQVPTSALVDYQGPHSEYREMEALLMPLTTDGQRIDRVMAVLQFFQDNAPDDQHQPDWMRVVGK